MNERSPDPATYVSALSRQSSLVPAEVADDLLATADMADSYVHYDQEKTLRGGPIPTDQDVYRTRPICCSVLD